MALKNYIIPCLVTLLFLLVESPSYADDTNTACSDEITTINGIFPDITGCYIPEKRFLDKFYVPDDKVLNVNPECLNFGAQGEQQPDGTFKKNYEKAYKQGFEKFADVECRFGDYLDDAMDFCKNFLQAEYKDAAGNPAVLVINPYERYLGADVYDPNATLAEIASNPGQKYKRQKCLELYINEYAHRSDCGELMLGSVPTYQAIEDCQIVQLPQYDNEYVEDGRNLNNELWDAFNFRQDSEIVESGNICGNMSLSEGPNSPFQKPGAYYFGARGCNEFEPVPGSKHHGCLPGINDLGQYIKNAGHFYQQIKSDEWGPENAPMHLHTRPPMDGQHASRKYGNYNTEPVRTVIMNTENAEDDGSSQIKKSNFQMPLGGIPRPTALSETFKRVMTKSGPPKIISDKNTKLDIERIRDTCHPFSLRKSVVPGLDTAAGRNLAEFFGYTSRCNKWVDHKLRKHESLAILNTRLERFDARWDRAFTGPGSGCGEFSCRCPSDEEPGNGDDPWNDCVLTKQIHEYEKWLRCFYKARDIACPILERDVSPTGVPGGAIPLMGGGQVGSTSMGNGLKDLENEDNFARWMYEEPNSLAMLPMNSQSDLSFSRHFGRAPFMAPVIPFPEPYNDRHGGWIGETEAKTLYNRGYDAAKNSFESSDPLSRLKETIVGPRGCHIGGWYEMLLYQARCIKFFGLNCICEYEKTFRGGSAEQYVIERGGVNFDSVIGKTVSADSDSGESNRDKKAVENKFIWPLIWRGYAGPDYAPNAAQDSKIWLNEEIADSAPEKGMDCAQVGDFVILDETVKLAHDKDQDPESCINHPNANEVCVGGQGGVPKDARLPRHIFYVESTGFTHFDRGDPNFMASIQTNSGDITTPNEAESAPKEPEAGYDPENPCKIKTGAGQRYVILSSYNWGKNFDSCGNTDRWGKKTRVIMWNHRFAPAEIAGNSCNDADNSICSAEWWRMAKVYRPRWDVKLPAASNEYPEPGADTPGDFTSYACKGPERLTSENASSSWEIKNIGRYDADRLREDLRSRIGVCDPPLHLRGTVIADYTISNLRPSGPREIEIGTAAGAQMTNDIPPGSTEAVEYPPSGRPIGPDTGTTGVGPSSSGSSGGSTGDGGNPGNGGSGSSGGSGGQSSSGSSGGGPGSGSSGGSGGENPPCTSCAQQASSKFWDVNGPNPPNDLVNCDSNNAPCVAARNEFDICKVTCPTCDHSPWIGPPSVSPCCPFGSVPQPSANCPAP